jgi:signal transduction histidine kinase/DNA-binding response OmpR family regulator
MARQRKLVAAKSKRGARKRPAPASRKAADGPARLRRELDEAHAQQAATAGILTVIAGSFASVQPVFDAIARSALWLIGGRSAIVVRRSGEELQLAAHTATSEIGDEALKKMYPMRLTGQGVVGKAVLGGEPTEVADFETDESYSPAVREMARARGTRSMLTVPMLRAGVGIGAINVTRSEAGAFTDRQVGLLRTFADQAVIAIENARLFTDLKASTEALSRSVHQLTALGEVGRAIGSTLQLETVLQTIVQRAVQLTGTDGGSIYEYDEQRGEFHLQAVDRVQDETLEAARRAPIRRGDGTVGGTAVTLQPVQVPDMLAGDYRSSRKEDLLRAGYRAILTVPLLRQDRVIGALSVTRKTPGEFAAELVELLKTFATQSAIAIQNARLFREIEDKGRQLEVASEHKSRFLASMSHEIRTPLNGVLGMAGLLADTRLDAEQRDYLETIRISGDALLAVINDILDYSKIESGRIDLESVPFEPARVVEESVEILGERARGKHLELIAEIDDAVPDWLQGDPGRLRQVLVNLVGNAVKFTERGEVLVRVRAAALDAGGALAIEFSVSDTGIGIRADRIQALFEPFTQADASTTRKYGGSGLGLAISRRLVELMGGRLTAESEPARGSTFRFTIAAQRAARPADAAVPSAAVDLAGRRILAVDDNATNLRILRRQLERWACIAVTAFSAADALALIDAGARFDVALLDDQLPGTDGVTLARELKRRVPLLPLVLLSSAMYHRGDDDAAGLFAMQLLKPVRQRSLHEAIACALGATQPAAQHAAREAQGAPPPVRPLSVLVVDDVDVNRRLGQILVRKFGHRAESVASGSEAIERVAAAQFDLVLIDLQMPEMDGFEAMQRIRARLGGAAPRIVAMTANAMPGDRERCLAAGMDGYVAKPIVPARLAEVLRQVPAAAPEDPPTQPLACALVDPKHIAAIEDCDDAERSLLREMLDSLRRDAPRYIGEIRAAAAAGDAAAVGRAAHALKGCAGSCGAAALSAAATRIEDEPGRGTGETELAALDDLLAQTAAALQERVRRSADSPEGLSGGL